MHHPPGIEFDCWRGIRIVSDGDGIELQGNKNDIADRIYTVNKGEMDNLLKHFKEDIMALHEKIGVPIVGTWLNRPQNQFNLGQDLQR